MDRIDYEDSEKHVGEGCPEWITNMFIHMELAEKRKMQMIVDVILEED